MDKNCVGRNMLMWSSCFKSKEKLLLDKVNDVQ